MASRFTFVFRGGAASMRIRISNIRRSLPYCCTVITIILLLLVLAVTFHIAAAVSFDGLTEALLDLDSLRSCNAFRA